jgi:hypothetical protein
MSGHADSQGFQQNTYGILKFIVDASLTYNPIEIGVMLERTAR